MHCPITGDADSDTIQIVIDAMADIVLFCEPDGRVRLVNQAFTSVTGCSAVDAVGKRPGELLQCSTNDETAGDAIESAIESAIANHRAVTQTIINACADGTEYHAEVRLNPVRDAGGTVVAMLFVERDITALVREMARRTDAERESARLRKQLSIAIEAMPDGFVLYDRDDRLVICNERYRQLYGDSEGKFVPGADFEDLLREDLAKGKFPDAIGREEAWVAERLDLHRNPGEPILQQLDDGTWLNVRELRTSDGGLVGLRTDVTELREKALELERLNAALTAALAARDKAEARFFDIAAISSDWFWEQDDEFRFTYVSSTLLESTGVDPATALGRRRAEMTAPGTIAGYASDPAWLEQRLAKREPFREFVYFFTDPGSASSRGEWVRISGAPFYDSAGEFAGYRGTGSNITALLEARQRAEEADKAKTQFLATMSHEIRTPMTALLGHAQLLQHGALTLDAPAGIGEHARAIGEAGELMLSLVNDCLDLAKIEEGKLALKRAPFSPAVLLERVARLHQARAEAAGLRVNIRCDIDPEARFIGDELRLLQVLNNLVSNAVAYTDEGSVTLTLQEGEDEGLVFEVQDTGPGLSADIAATLFDRFAQGASAAGRGGTGLGLAVVRQLVDLMRGTVDVLPLRSLAGEQRRGTVMRVTLPLPPEEAARTEQRSQAADQHNFSALRVLAVDDVVMNREVIGAMLDFLGPAAVIVSSGQAALDAIQSESFNTYLIDISMPDLDGPGTLAALRRLEQADGRQTAHAVAMTAHAFEHQRTTYLDAGFDEVLVKPLTLDSLRGALAAALPPKMRGLSEGTSGHDHLSLPR
ncbi:MAG: ATP-binding protein [Pseudomonadota bacterium]